MYPTTQKFPPLNCDGRVFDSVSWGSNRCTFDKFGQLSFQGPKMGINVAMPKVVGLDNDRTETYLKAVRSIIEPGVQLIVTIFPQMRSDRYAAIKKLCVSEKPVANQCINLKTISNEKKVTSVVQKIALQINCKLGGEVSSRNSNCFIMTDRLS